MDRIYKNTKGIPFEVTFRKTIEDASAITFIVLRPDNKTVEWVATIDTDANTGTYILQEGDLDIAGLYSYQAKIEFTGGAVTYTNKQVFEVYEPVQAQYQRTEKLT